MVIDILLFILCIGAYLFVKGTSGLARKLHIPKLIVERLASGAHLFRSMNHQLKLLFVLRENRHFRPKLSKK